MAVLVVASAFVIPPPAKETVTLAYAFKTGDAFVLEQITRQTVVQTIMGMEQTGENRYDGTIGFRVISVTGNQAKLEAKLSKLKSHIKNVISETDMDSEGDQRESANKIVKSMMNRPFYVTVSIRGEVEKVEGVDNLWKGFDDLDISTDDKKKLKPMISQMINESAFRNGLGQAFIPYPGRKIGAGDTWTSQNGIPADFPVRADNTWKIDRMERSRVSLAGKGNFQTTDTEKVVILPGGMKAKVNLTGSQQVSATPALKTGFSEAIGIEAALNGKIKLLAGGILPMDVEVPITITTRTDYKFTKK